MTAVPAPARPVSDLNWIREAVLTGEAGVHEARIALALLLNPGLRGSRALEVAAGLSRALVLTVVPDIGGSSALLSTSSRGSSAFRHSRPLKVSFQPRQSVLHRMSNPISKISRTRRTGVDVVLDVVPAVPATQYITGDADEADMRRVLDPSLDLWSNTDQSSVGVRRAGSHGWLLVLTYGLRPVELSMAELGQLWQLGERATRNAVNRLIVAGWLTRHSRGRRVTVAVDFSLLPILMDSDVYVWDDRAAHRSQVHGLEVQRFARRHTALGMRVWLTLRHRVHKLAELPDGACRVWRRLLSRVTEEQLYDMLSTRPGRLLRA